MKRQRKQHVRQRTINKKANEHASETVCATTRGRSLRRFRLEPRGAAALVARSLWRRRSVCVEHELKLEPRVLAMNDVRLADFAEAGFGVQSDIFLQHRAICKRERVTGEKNAPLW